MPHDPALVEDTRGWLVKASLDLRAAQHDLEASPPLLADAVFHCQQAAEKALKAFLAWHDEPFRKTHNLEELGRQAAALDSSLGSLVDRAGGLTDYAPATASRTPCWKRATGAGGGMGRFPHAKGKTEARFLRP